MRLNLIRSVLVLVTALSSQSAWALSLKIATISPDGSFWMQKMRQGAKNIEQKTEGRVKFKFYPGGVMGDAKTVLRKIRIGQLHGGALTGGNLTRFYKDYQVYALPMKYQSPQELNYVRKFIDGKIIRGFEKGGFVTFGLTSVGSAYLMSTNRPVGSIEDLTKQKVWVPANDAAAVELVKGFEFTPIPLPLGDVLAGLQTELINTVIIPPIGAIALQWHTQIKYLTNLPVLYSFGTLAIGKKAFGKIKPVDQKIVREVMGSIFQEIDAKNEKDNMSALEALKANGVIFVEPTTDQLAEWKKRSVAAKQRMVQSGKISEKMLQEVDKLLADYRSRP